ncbi:MAG: cobyrinate a,c-diamide synthase [Patescibacteria group bacterium]
MKYPRVIISATHSGAGKTTVSCGIMLALIRKGLKVSPYKAGPDYIDPGYHTQITAVISRNLDGWMLSKRRLLELFKSSACDTDISVIEGVMGLYDGLRDSPAGSTAHLAKLLKCPVILIIDAHSLSRSAAAIALGYKYFDRKVKIRAIILNNIGSKNHYFYTKAAIEAKTKIPVIGYLPKEPGLELAQRHLGLVPAQETKLKDAFREKLLSLVSKNIDLGMILKIAKRAPLLAADKQPGGVVQRNSRCATIAVARDRAFNFYYQDNLDILRAYGARLVTFSPLSDKKLPCGIDGLYIGGGFPELFASELSKNNKLRDEICYRAKEGLPVYAECGGLMYLVKKLVDFKKKSFPMTGIFNCSVNMADKLQALGYVEIEVLRDNILSKKGDRNRAHAFHWSYLAGLPKETKFAYRLKKNNKVFDDGLIYKNVLAGYTHLHFASNLHFARNFIRSCRERGREDTKNK